VKREDEQTLIDKVVEKLPRWKGKLLNKLDRLSADNSGDIPYDSFPLSKWTIKKYIGFEVISCGTVWRRLEQALVKYAGSFE
jgi:hypothetical protein